MAKFNKDTFLNEITSKVQSAIDKNLITKDDISNRDLVRLHGFIQYELLEYIEDRKFAIDVLKDFNYDEKNSWQELQETFGTFKSLMDIALVNLWKFLDAEGACSYEYYNHTSYDEDSPMLDLVHDLEKTEETPPYEEENKRHIGNIGTNYSDDERYDDERNEKPRLRRIHNDDAKI